MNGQQVGEKIGEAAGAAFKMALALFGQVITASALLIILVVIGDHLVRLNAVASLAATTVCYAMQVMTPKSRGPTIAVTIASWITGAIAVFLFMWS